MATQVDTHVERTIVVHTKGSMDRSNDERYIFFSIFRNLRNYRDRGCPRSGGFWLRDGATGIGGSEAPPGPSVLVGRRGGEEPFPLALLLRLGAVLAVVVLHGGGSGQRRQGESLSVEPV